MSTKIKNEDGTETEVFTAEEVQAQATAQVTSAVEAAKTEAAAQLQVKEAELAKLKEKEMNFGQVKKSEEDKAKEVEKLQSEITNLKGVVVDNFKNDLIKRYAGTDAELAKKIEAEYKTFTGEAVTNDEIALRMERAAKLVGVQAPSSAANNAFGSVGGRGQGNLGQEAIVIAPEVKAVGAKMGLTEADYKKYGDKIK